MNLSSVAFLVAGYGDEILLYVFWAAVGLSLLSPMVLVEAAYRHAKIDNRYHFRDNYYLKRLKKRHYSRKMVLHGLILLVNVALAAYLLS